MKVFTAPENIFQSFGLDSTAYVSTPLQSGHINATFKLTGESSYVLQRINTVVFNNPEYIAKNLREAEKYLALHHPNYLFLSSIKTGDGKEMAYDGQGFPWRLFPYIENTKTINTVQTADEAYEAARVFGELTKNLSGCALDSFQETIPHFHDAPLRLQQFENALKTATEERREVAEKEIESARIYQYLVNEYARLIHKKVLVRRIHHHDTKINNVLFDVHTQKAVCVIDLDTLMPGYFLSDVGDMIRTFVSVYENETDLGKVVVRRDIYDALVSGYLETMATELTDEEKKYIPFAGQIMTYILALRMLTDYLNGNVYFHAEYELQNLDRAKNQFRLTELLVARDQNAVV